MALEEDIDVLQKSELFSLFNIDALRLLAFAAENRNLKAGDALFQKGDRADSGYIVKSGKLLLGSREDGLGEPVPAGPGTLIGKLALFIRNIRPITVTAVTEASLIRVSPTLMRRILEEYPDCADASYEALADDLQELTGNLENIRMQFLKNDKP